MINGTESGEGQTKNDNSSSFDRSASFVIPDDPGPEVFLAMRPLPAKDNASELRRLQSRLFWSTELRKTAKCFDYYLPFQKACRLL